jgi:serine/threonine protein kinase
LKPIPTAENDTKTSAVRYEPVLIDFETAVVDSNAATPHQSGQRTMMTMMSASTGTAGYMDPEVIRGHAQVTQKSDMYAFGVVMGELLVGRRLAAPADVEACEGVDERVRDMLSNLLSAEGQMRCVCSVVWCSVV